MTIPGPATNLGVTNRPGLPLLSALEREGLRQRLVMSENVLSDREKAEIRYQMQAEAPYPDNAEMALFNSDMDRGTEWVPVSQRRFVMPGDTTKLFTATSIWFRVDGEILHSRTCRIGTVPGGEVTIVLPPTSWAEYVKRNNLPAEWVTEADT